MRRPILLPFCSLIFGMIFVSIQGQEFTGIFVVFFLGIATLIVLFTIKAKIDSKSFNIWLKRLICIIVFLAVGMSIFSREANRNFSLNEYDGTVVTLSGSIIFAENKSKDLYYLTLLVREGQGLALETPEKVLVRVYGPLENFQDLVGRSIQIRGELEIPSSARNPKCFDYEKYLKTKKIASIINVNPRFIVNKGWQGGIVSLGWRILNKISLVKCEFLNTLSQEIPAKQMALVKGMLFGDKNDIDDQLMLEFQRNSTAHILAVSGLHVGLVYFLLKWIFRKRNSLIFDIVILLFLIVYGCMSFFAPSVTRAIFMIGLHIGAKRFNFRYDLLSATFFTAGVILLFNPMMLLNAGFQLSYIALLSMSFLIPFFNRYLPFVILKPFLPLIAIQIGLIPLIAFHFNHLTLIGIIANIPTVFLAGLIIPLLIIIFPLHFILSGVLINIVAVSIKWLIQFLVFMNEFLYFDGKFTMLIPSPSFWSIFLFYSLLFFISSELVGIWIERKHLMMVVGSIILILLISFLLGIIQEDEFKNTDIIFLDVGQGDCLFFETPSGKTVMIDSGGSSQFDVGRKTLLPYLLKNGYCKLDLAVVTHLHEDHYGGFKTLSKEIQIGGLVLYEGYETQKASIVSESGFKENQLIFVRKGDTIKLDERVFIEFFYPEKWEQGELYCPEDENQMSLVMMVIYDGLKILMTGDIDAKGELAVIDAVEDIEDLECNILKVPHHGSKYSMSDSFIKYTNPNCAVIQVGKNNFGHPSSSILEKCLERDIIVFRNDWHGAIGIKGENWDGQNLWLKTMITKEI